MAFMELTLDLDKDLTIDNENRLSVNVSQSANNTLEIKDDGLYAKASRGLDGSNGRGYEGRILIDYVMLGYSDSFYPQRLEARKILCTSVVHRIFDATIADDGSVSLNGFREVDTIFVGDFFRVNLPDRDGFAYYIVTETTTSRTNNTVVKYEKLGEI